MTRTIDERIDAAIDEIDASTLGLQRSDIQEILKQHFAEPWLDAPDGPGWWWITAYDQLATTYVKPDEFECGYCSQGSKWQRAIGPSW